MSTSVTFENAALSEAIKRAMRVAPTRGEAFDKASGIVLEINPANEWPVIIKTTNLSIYYSEFVNAIESEGDATTWRVSSELFGQIATKLPIGSGKHVTISEEGNRLSIKSGRFKASIGLVRNAFYPEWGLFDPATTAEVLNLGARLNQVLWACTKGNGMESTDGVRFDGENLYATDKYRLASVPMEAAHLGEGVTINANLIAGLVPEGQSVRIGLVEDQLLILPNDFIQIRCIALAAEFLPVQRVMQRDYPNKVTFDKQYAIDAISRVVTADSKNRMPELTIFIGKEELVFFMEDSSGIDKLMDQVDVPGFATHDRHKIFINPSSLIDAMQNAPSTQVTLHYDTSDGKRLLYLEGDSEYEAWLVPRTGQRQQAEEGEG